MKKLFVWCGMFIMGCCGIAALQAEESVNVEKKQKKVVIETTMGNIEVTLFTDLAPKTCENFLGLANKKYYDGTIFHRIIPQFMIQGGDPEGTGRGGKSLWGGNFEDEFSPSLKFNTSGLLAMANRGPNTNGSQFFITTALTEWLNQKHTIFGKVTKGYEVVQAIEGKGTSSGTPKETIKIIKISVK